MKAIAYRANLPIDDAESLIDVEVAEPELRPRDLLVRVEAVSVNPVDTSQRASAPSGGERILGFDASGTVVAVGADVTLFEVGDDVFYAGTIDRPGTDAELHAVDERIVGRKPATLSHPEAAALPLTSITAWESLFDKLALTTASRGTLLVLGGAGGVASMVIQLAKALTGLTVIGTGSRPESRAWATRMGADFVVDHSADLAAQVAELAPAGVDCLFTPLSTSHVSDYAAVLRPFGQIVAIGNPKQLDTFPLKGKSLSWHWESMFARPVHQTADMVAQHELLDAVAGLIDAGAIVPTLTETLTPFSAASLRRAHAMVEGGRMIGKVVVSR